MTDRSAHEYRFAASRKQLQRIWRISAMLKRRRWVTMKEFLREFADTEIEAGADLSCVNRTVQRNIRILKDEYGAPIEYSKSQCAYHLTDRDWSLDLPMLLDQDELLAIAASDKIAQDIFPESISRRISQVVDKVLQDNNSELFASGVASSLRILIESRVSAEIFQAIFEAWSKRQVIQIRYADRDGNVVTRDVEPHALVFHDMMWSIKGFCRLRQDVRIFNLGRIVAAVGKEERFKPRQEIVDSITSDSFFEYESIRDVTLKLNERGRRFAELYPLHSRQSFELEEDSYLMFVPEIAQERLIPWILRQQGDAKPISPPRVVEAVRDSIRRLADACQAYDPNEIRKKVRKRSAKEQHP